MGEIQMCAFFFFFPFDNMQCCFLILVFDCVHGSQLDV